MDGWNPAKAGATGTSNFDVWATFTSGGSLITRQIQGDGIDQHLAYVTSSNAYWYLTDHLGSTRATINNSDTVQDSIIYDAYGNITSQSNASAAPLYTYTGRELDVETGLQYNRARWYDPGTGRWITQDPMGFDAGDSNLYRYVHNLVRTLLDPSGLQGQSLSIQAGGVIRGLDGQFFWPIKWQVQGNPTGWIIQEVRMYKTIYYVDPGYGYVRRLTPRYVSGAPPFADYYEAWKVTKGEITGEEQSAARAALERELEKTPDNERVKEKLGAANTPPGDYAFGILVDLSSAFDDNINGWAGLIATGYDTWQKLQDGLFAGEIDGWDDYYINTQAYRGPNPEDLSAGDIAFRGTAYFVQTKNNLPNSFTIGGAPESIFPMSTYYTEVTSAAMKTWLKENGAANVPKVRHILEATWNAWGYGRLTAVSTTPRAPSSTPNLQGGN